MSDKTAKIISDIEEAKQYNWETTRELMELGYLSNICILCLDPACSGEYTHYES